MTKYNVILADPPWKYTNDMVYGHRSTDHYPSMELEDMKNLDIKSLCDSENCVLFMWTTGPKLDWALELGQAWGFQYSQVAFVWDKQRTIAGCYTITECEFVLVFKLKKLSCQRGLRLTPVNSFKRNLVNTAGSLNTSKT